MIDQIAIATHPHRNADDAEEFVENLMSTRRYYRGEDAVPDKLDIAAFNRFKDQVGKQSITLKSR